MLIAAWYRILGHCPADLRRGERARGGRAPCRVQRPEDGARQCGASFLILLEERVRSRTGPGPPRRPGSRSNALFSSAKLNLLSHSSVVPQFAEHGEVAVAGELRVDLGDLPAGAGDGRIRLGERSPAARQEVAI
jgi:hypothetical protein